MSRIEFIAKRPHRHRAREDATPFSIDDWAARLAQSRHSLIDVALKKPGLIADFAQGTWDIQDLRSGLSLEHYDVTYACDADVSVAYRPHAYLGLLLEGWHEGNIGGHTCNLRRIGVPCLYAAADAMEAAGQVREGQKCRAIGIRIDQHFFEGLGDDQDDAAFRALRGLMHEPFVWRHLEHSTLLRVHLQDIAECPFTGVMACLHCESRALALLIELASHLHVASPAPRPVLRKDRHERVQHVRHIVDSNLDKPISVSEIARRVGSNETTLRLDFKAVFGTTIYGYLRDRRLDVARRLVHEGQLPIATIAYLSGYSSPANFSTAYRKRFGVAPSTDCCADPHP